MQIKSLMSTNVFTIEMDDTISNVKYIFEEMGFHHLLVVAEEKLIGVISDRDLLKALSPNVDSTAATTHDLATLNKRAHQIMSRNPICLDDTATVLDAIKLFHENKISCIPIVNTENKAVGIVSWRDIMKVLAEKSQ